MVTTMLPGGDVDDAVEGAHGIVAAAQALVDDGHVAVGPGDAEALLAVGLELDRQGGGVVGERLRMLLQGQVDQAESVEGVCNLSGRSGDGEEGAHWDRRV